MVNKVYIFLVFYNLISFCPELDSEIISNKSDANLNIEYRNERLKQQRDNNSTSLKFKEGDKSSIQGHLANDDLQQSLSNIEESKKSLDLMEHDAEPENSEVDLQADKSREAQRLQAFDKHLLQEEIKNRLDNYDQRLRLLTDLIKSYKNNNTLVKTLLNFYKISKLDKLKAQIAKQKQFMESAKNYITKKSDIYYLESRKPTSLKNLKIELDNIHILQDEYKSKVQTIWHALDPEVKEYVSSFIDYAATLPKKLRPLDINKVVYDINYGHRLFNDLKNGQLLMDSSSPQIRLKQIRRMQWLLYAQAIKENPIGFTSGMIQVLDPGSKLYNFLNSVDISVNKSNFIKIENRESTHYKNLRLTSQGLNFRDAEGNLDYTQLPNGKSHLLFGKLPDVEQTSRLYIKWETSPFGVSSENFYVFRQSVLDSLRHVIDFIKSRGLKNAGKKEHVPFYITSEFDLFLKDNGIDLTKERRALLKSKGIGGMFELFDDLQVTSVNSKKLAEARIKFSNYVEAFDLYSDTKSINKARKGAEVIINLS